MILSDYGSNGGGEPPAVGDEARGAGHAHGVGAAHGVRGAGAHGGGVNGVARAQSPGRGHALAGEGSRRAMGVSWLPWRGEGHVRQSAV